jgi:alanine-glyoxylate transaminase / serine-glyoxylate transaminase / serine-pyruvate transaminase
MAALSPGNMVLMAETGHLAALWKGLAEEFKLEVDFLAGDWRRAARPAEIEACNDLKPAMT